MNKATTVRLEKGESFVVFGFEGGRATMKNSFMERDEMSESDAYRCIEAARGDGWVDVDAE